MIAGYFLQPCEYQGDAGSIAKQVMTGNRKMRGNRPMAHREGLEIEGYCYLSDGTTTLYHPSFSRSRNQISVKLSEVSSDFYKENLCAWVPR